MVTKGRRNLERFQVSLHILQAFFPFFLSHHPDCEDYRSHVLTIGSIKLCQGCSAMYSGLILLILTVWTRVVILPERDFIFVFLTGFLFFFPTLLHLYWSFSPRIIRLTVRFLGGISIGLLFWSAWIFSEFINVPVVYASPVKFISTLVFFSIYFGMQNIHVVKARTHCTKACSSSQESPYCTGFQSFWERISKINNIDLYYPNFAKQAKSSLNKIENYKLKDKEV
ncbi:MAG: hypothetical protein ACTSW1_09280 [Candidatus Hodarchaeales archaeon]